MADEESTYFCVLTSLGAELEAKAHAEEKAIVVTKVAVGDGGGEEPTPQSSRTALVNQVYEREPDYLKQDDDDKSIFWVSMTIPADVGGWWIREFGIYAQDLDGGDDILIAYGTHAPYYKMLPTSNQSTTHEIKVPIVMSNEGELTITVDESAYATHTEVDDLKALVESLLARVENSLVDSIASTPNCYRRAGLFEVTQTSVTVLANTQVNINGSGYVSTADTVLQLDDFVAKGARHGVDCYIYACQPADESSTEPVFVISRNSTVPDGYDADTSRKIGGFHCLCADVGTISGHTLSGYVAGDILPASVWDLLHRAESENEGMAWIAGRGIWMDIYLASWDGSQLVSEYGGTVVNGTSTTPMHGEKFNEVFGLQKKFLFKRDDFVVAAKGSNENTPIKGEAQVATTGGNVDTADRRMISNFGLEDCCGAYYQWTCDLHAAPNAAISDSITAKTAANRDSANEGNYYLSYYRFDDPAYGEDTGNTNDCSRLYHPDVDGDERCGDMYGALVRFRVGAAWSSGSSCGSRSVYLHDLSAIVGTGNAARGASGPRVVNAL